MKEKRSHDESVIARKQRGTIQPMQSDNRDASEPAAAAATDADVQVTFANITTYMNKAVTDNCIFYTDQLISYFCNSFTITEIT